MQNLMNAFGGERGQHALDLACGSGRHSGALAELGLHVTGVDLSAESIARAKERGVERTEFHIADMRTFDLNDQFDWVVNLFTSFGYFESDRENLRVLNQIKKHLKTNGRLVIDFLNPIQVKKNLVESEVVAKDGVTFHIERSHTATHVYKTIQIEGLQGKFEERVQLLGPSDFERLATEAGLNIVATFGDYDLSDFEEHSPRQIHVAQL